jgi:hypothetical protein
MYITLNKQTYVMDPRNQSTKKHGKSFLMCNFLITEEKNDAQHAHSTSMVKKERSVQLSSSSHRNGSSPRALAAVATETAAVHEHLVHCFCFRDQQPQKSIALA